MICQTHTTRRSFIQAVIRTACAAGFALASTALGSTAWADKPPHSSATVAEKVSFSGLDLSTPEGARAA